VAGGEESKGEFYTARGRREGRQEPGISFWSPLRFDECDLMGSRARPGRLLGKLASCWLGLNSRAS
jgi:hypothetical protein